MILKIILKIYILEHNVDKLHLDFFCVYPKNTVVDIRELLQKTATNSKESKVKKSLKYTL